MGRKMEWIDAKEALPDYYQPVLIWRCGGQNQDHIAFAQRLHKSGTRDEWEWNETRGGLSNYWGTACDGSTVSHWMPLPESPEVKDGA